MVVFRWANRGTTWVFLKLWVSVKCEPFSVFHNLGRRFVTSKMHLSPHWIRLLSVLRRWSVVVHSFYNAVPIVGVPCLVLVLLRNTFIWGLLFVSVLVLQSSWWRREIWLLCFDCLPGDCYCSVVLSDGAVGWSAVCDCSIPESYSLNYF